MILDDVRENVVMHKGRPFGFIADYLTESVQSRKDKKDGCLVLKACKLNQLSGTVKGKPELSLTEAG